MEEQIIIETPKEMRKKHFPSLSDGEEDTLKEYFQDFTSRGITLNPKLCPSRFHLENGLPYIGMAAKDEIKGGEVLIRVPEELILSADKAFAQPALKEIYKDRFFIQPKDHQKEGDQFDEDKVIIIYALYLLTRRQENNLWFKMISKFPDQCDIACFWSEEQLDQILDKTVKSGAQISLKSFEKQWNQFEELQRKYQLLQQKEFNKHNYRRVYITLSNRAFGYQVKYVSLVPMAQYFNHHASKVSYSLQKRKETYLSEQKDETSSTSSLGSCDSFQFFEEGQFDYDKLDIVPLDYSPTEIGNHPIKEKAKIQKEISFFIDSLDDLLNWKDFSIIFIAHITHTAKSIEKNYLQGRKDFDKVMMDLKVLNKSVDKYKHQITEYYKLIKKKDYIEKEKIKPKYDKFQFKQPKKLYQSLIIKTSNSDKFQTNNQVYFRYGYNCNRSLLLHYGFAIRGNKYDHSWMTFNIADCLSDFPDILQKTKQRKLSLMRKFKLYHHRLNMDMIYFFRLNSWTFYGQNAIDDIFTVTDSERELSILEQILSIIEEYAEIYQGDYDLTDKKLGYHQYFITVYHLEKLTIYKKQIKMFQLLIEIMKKLQEGLSLKEASKHLSESERGVLKPYLNTIKI